MRVVRRVSLLLGVVLIVAIAVGYLARTNELERSRDLRLVNEARIAASELAALVDTVSVASDAGRVPDVVAESLARVIPDHGVCAVSPAFTRCAGDGPLPPDDVIAEVERARRDVDLPVERRDAQVTVYERRVTIAADGPLLSIVVAVPVGADATVWPTTFLPAGATGTDFFDDGNLRQTAVAVPGATGVYVVAAGEREVALPTAEQLFHTVVFTLSVVLLVLAGVTLVMEHRGLVERASLDRLTQLPNRSEFERCVESAFADGEPGACLLLFDLDGFKEVNDDQGHEAGDRLLGVVGAHLRAVVRAEDLVARYGGDEFVVVAGGLEEPEAALRLGRRMLAAVERAGVEGGGELSASIGVAMVEPGRSADDLLRAADAAMYAAKFRGGGRVWLSGAT